MTSAGKRSNGYEEANRRLPSRVTTRNNEYPGTERLGAWVAPDGSRIRLPNVDF
jgi:hypothetical protein